MDEDWRADLERWLAPHLESLGNKTRRRMCPAYIASLIGAGDRKSIHSKRLAPSIAGANIFGHSVAA